MRSAAARIITIEDSQNRVSAMTSSDSTCSSRSIEVGESGGKNDGEMGDGIDSETSRNISRDGARSARNCGTDSELDNAGMLAEKEPVQLKVREKRNFTHPIDHSENKTPCWYRKLILWAACQFSCRVT